MHAGGEVLVSFPEQAPYGTRVTFCELELTTPWKEHGCMHAPATRALEIRRPGIDGGFSEPSP